MRKANLAKEGQGKLAIEVEELNNTAASAVSLEMQDTLIPQNSRDFSPPETPSHLLQEIGQAIARRNAPHRELPTLRTVQSVARLLGKRGIRPKTQYGEEVIVRDSEMLARGINLPQIQSFDRPAEFVQNRMQFLKENELARELFDQCATKMERERNEARREEQRRRAAALTARIHAASMEGQRRKMESSGRPTASSARGSSRRGGEQSRGGETASSARGDSRPTPNSVATGSPIVLAEGTNTYSIFLSGTDIEEKAGTSNDEGGKNGSTMRVKKPDELIPYPPHTGSTTFASFSLGLTRRPPPEIATDTKAYKNKVALVHREVEDAQQHYSDIVEKHQRAHEQKQIRQEKGALQKEWLKALMLSASITLIRNTTNPHLRKMKKRRNVLIAACCAGYWWQKMHINRRRKQELAVNCIFRKYIPAWVGRIRRQKKQAAINKIHVFITDLKTVFHFPRAIKRFATKVRDAQRIVLRHLYARRLWKAAMLLAWEKAMNQDLQDYLLLSAPADEAMNDPKLKRRLKVLRNELKEQGKIRTEEYMMHGESANVPVLMFIPLEFRIKVVNAFVTKWTHCMIAALIDRDRRRARGEIVDEEGSEPGTPFGVFSSGGLATFQPLEGSVLGVPRDAGAGSRRASRRNSVFDASLNEAGKSSATTREGARPSRLGVGGTSSMRRNSSRSGSRINITSSPKTPLAGPIKTGSMSRTSSKAEALKGVRRETSIAGRRLLAEREAAIYRQLNGTSRQKPKNEGFSGFSLDPPSPEKKSKKKAPVVRAKLFVKLAEIQKIIRVTQRAILHFQEQRRDLRFQRQALSQRMNVGDVRLPTVSAIDPLRRNRVLPAIAIIHDLNASTNLVSSPVFSDESAGFTTQVSQQMDVSGVATPAVRKAIRTGVMARNYHTALRESASSFRVSAKPDKQRASIDAGASLRPIPEEVKTVSTVEMISFLNTVANFQMDELHQLPFPIDVQDNEKFFEANPEAALDLPPKKPPSEHGSDSDKDDEGTSDSEGVRRGSSSDASARGGASSASLRSSSPASSRRRLRKQSSAIFGVDVPFLEFPHEFGFLDEMIDREVYKSMNPPKNYNHVPRLTFG